MPSNEEYLDQLLKGLSENPEDEPSLDLNGLDGLLGDDTQDMTADMPTETPEDLLSDMPTEAPEDLLSDMPTETPEDLLSDMPTEMPEDLLSDMPTEAPEDLSDMPTETPVDLLSDMPTETPEDLLSDMPTETPVDLLSDMPTETPEDVLSEMPTETPVDLLADMPTEAPEDLLADMPMEAPADLSAEALAEAPALSEEEIDELLQANRLEGLGAEDDGLLDEDKDLMSLLEAAQDEGDDLQDIHDMLQKSDNNEALDEDGIARLQALPELSDESEGVASELQEESGDDGLTARQRKALEKKRLREEKAAARKAAKEAKKAEKLKKKAAQKGGNKAEEDLTGEPGGETAPEGSRPGAAQDPDMGTSGLGTGMPDPDVRASDLGMGMSDPGRETPDRDIPAEDASLDELFGSELFADVLPEEEASGEEDADDGAGSEEAAMQSGQPKKNLFARILDFLTEEDEDEEIPERGTEDIPLSDENRQVLDEMDQEEAGGKGKKKKKKKEKKPKEKPGKAAPGDDEEAEEEGQEKKKPKKAKKEKPPRETAPVDPRHRITFKKILPILLVCASLMLIIILFVNLGGDFVQKSHARKAFYDEDYETCYQELYGRKLNESEQVMYGKSESILHIRLWMREYELFAQEGDEVRALDVLIQSVNDYAGLYEYAQQWNAGNEVSEIYGRILAILGDKYDLTEAQALAIAAEPDDEKYTRLVTEAAQGGGYPSGTDSDPSGSVNLPDMLPEEKQFPENNGGR